MTKKETIEKLIPDTSVLIEGDLSKKLEKKEVIPNEITIHEAVLSELEHQANQNRAIGHLGLEEIRKIKEICKKDDIVLSFGGDKPRPSEIKYAKLGEIDALIRDLAYNEGATLMTADRIQAKVAETKGMKVIFIDIIREIRKLKLEKYFDNTTMSVHLRENIEPYAKKGFPGEWNFVVIKKKKLTREEMMEISREIIEEANVRRDCFIEIERPGSTIVQLGHFRIVIVRPPFSDAWEITAVRPVKHLELKEYSITEKLMERFTEQAEGVIIAGSPGMGKSTFCAALAQFYSETNKVVKTVEAPRDLVLPESITQFAISHGDSQEVHDILLLSRPDYTFFDEMRNTNDFKLFADLRLAGIGFIGVVHATNPIDAIQRFVGRIELGVIPQVIDTVIFIKNGKIDKVLSLQMTVKVPSGMTEADLARPIVVVHDFETNKLEYELYSYGEETVVIPVSSTKSESSSPAKQLAAKEIERQLQYYSKEIKVELSGDNRCTVYVPEHRISKIIGRQGKNISEIEKRIGIKIDVKELEHNTENITGESIDYKHDIGKKSIHFYVDDRYANNDVNIMIDGEFHMSARVSKKGVVKLKKNSGPGRVLMNNLNQRDRVELVI